MTEKKISELENMSIETSKNTQQREKKKKDWRTEYLRTVSYNAKDTIQKKGMEQKKYLKKWVIIIVFSPN